MTVTENIYGSLDIQYEYTFNDAVDTYLSTNILAVPPFEIKTVNTEYKILGIRIETKTESGITYVVCKTELNGDVYDQASYPLGTNYAYQRERIRIFIHNTDLSVYVGGKWVYSFVLGYVNYVTDLVEAALSIQGGSLTVYNIKRIELHDYRDAVYVDYEATADSAMQSIIQERPVQVFSEPERKLSFTYNCVKDIVTAHHVKEYSTGIVANSSMSSDGLIYYTNVSIGTSEQTAEEVGLVTRLYRLSNLETGAQRATGILQKLALERRYPIGASLRFDPRLVIADELLLGPVGSEIYLTGTGTQIQDICIIEDINLSLSDGAYSFNVRGRTLKDA